MKCSSPIQPPQAPRAAKQCHWLSSLAGILALILVAGCAAPMGADRVLPRQAYDQVEANALSTGQPSAATISLLHRYNLEHLAREQPAEAVRQLYPIAVSTGDRDLLFALAEVSYVAGDELRHNVKPWRQSDPRDYYLGSAIYAYLFLFGEGKGARPDAFDRRFRVACDLYNYGLGWSLTNPRSTNAVVTFADGRRRLPVGEIELKFSQPGFPWPLKDFHQFLVADQFRVRGFSMRNRPAGIGAPLIAVGQTDAALHIKRATPATVLLRGPDSLAALESGNASGSLELYSPFDQTTVSLGQATVPLEMDLTTPAAYMLNQSFIWQLDWLQFFSPAQVLKSQLLLSRPYQRGRVPVVFVHGTFSNPVWWAEMVNTLNADPEIRERCQIWQFLYSSGNPIFISAKELRDALTAKVHELDPNGQDPALQQMVVIGHSQGGLLTKLTVTDTGDQLWRVLSDKPLDESKLTTAQQGWVRTNLFFTPLPFVRDVVFICTPHRGSYLASKFVRRIIYKLISFPKTAVQRSADFLLHHQDIKLPRSFRGQIPTSVDGMSPENPFLLKLADIPVSPNVQAHSIVAINSDAQPPDGVDGVVSYRSAHVDYVESEYIVRSGHSCQSKPATIEEVRRILREHLASLPPPDRKSGAGAQP